MDDVNRDDGAPKLMEHMLTARLDADG